VHFRAHRFFFVTLFCVVTFAAT